MSLTEKCAVWQMGAFWGSDRKWDSISKGFQAELFCSIQMEMTQLEERASKLGFGWLIWGVGCMPFIWLNVALLGTSGGGQKVPASAEGKPMHFCLLCLSAAQPGIWRDYHLNTARGKRIICLTEILGVTKFFFIPRLIQTRWLEQTALPTRSSIDSIQTQSGCDCSLYSA